MAESKKQPAQRLAAYGISGENKWKVQPINDDPNQLNMLSRKASEEVRELLEEGDNLADTPGANEDGSKMESTSLEDSLNKNVAADAAEDLERSPTTIASSLESSPAMPERKQLVRNQNTKLPPLSKHHEF
jgi:hypothetical protein